MSRLRLRGLARPTLLLATAILAVTSCSAHPAGRASSHRAGTLLPGSASPPPLPPEIALNLPGCGDPAYYHSEVDPVRPANPRLLAAQAWRVVLADAVSQRPLWVMTGDGSPPNAPNGMESATATNFRVVKVIKGAAPPWLQYFQWGVAAPGVLSCRHYLDVIKNEPPPKVGSRYVLFDWGHLFPQTWASPNPIQAEGYQGPLYRFLVIDGVVHSESEFDPAVESMPIKPQPLETFLKSLGL